MKTFAAKRVAKSFALEIAASADELFALLCPVREYEWIDGWDCEMVYSESGVAETGCVFTTAGIPMNRYTVWVTTDRDERRRTMDFVRVTPGLVVSQVHVRVEPRTSTGSMLHWAYEFTALGQEGNRWIEESSADDCRLLSLEMQALAKMLEHFLRTGTMLAKEQWLV